MIAAPHKRYQPPNAIRANAPQRGCGCLSSGIRAARTWAGTGRPRFPLAAAEAAAGALPGAAGAGAVLPAARAARSPSPSRPQGKRRLPGRAESEARQHGALGRRWRRREELGARSSALGAALGSRRRDGAGQRLRPRSSSRRSRSRPPPSAGSRCPGRPMSAGLRRRCRRSAGE